jgi:hypothetical protein
MWHFLHTMSFNYPVSPTAEQKKHYKEFILSLKNVLPCGKCRSNLSKNLKKLPPDAKHFASRDAFSKYIYRLHETVNTMLGKKSGLSYAEVRNRYEHFRARCYLDGKTERPIHKETEIGCVDPIYGTKSKCLLRIVPLSETDETMKIDEKCMT